MTRSVIAGGTVITASDTVVATVLIEGERILGVVAPDSELAQGFSASADFVVDASGKYVIPGGIDAHTHFQAGDPGSERQVPDTFATGTVAAAFGGTTTIIDFARPRNGLRMPEGVDDYFARTDGQCSVDYAFHAMAFNTDELTPKEMDVLIDRGVTSFKMFTAYPDDVMSTDDKIFRVMQHASTNGALVMMHAENGPVIDVLREQAVARGDVDPVWHSLTRPALLEAEAVHRTIVLSEVAGSPLYIVHLSSPQALREIMGARDRGLPVYAETCPQYLYLDLDNLREPDFGGSKYVCSPPIRIPDDRDLLWTGLSTGALHTVATDHCPFCFSQKELGRGDFRAIPNGVPGVEHRVEQIYKGVVDGHLSLNRWVDVCSTSVAKMFGMHPKKGTIAAGADADVVIFDPAATHTLSAKTHHMNVDYSVYEGQELPGKVVTTFVRGRRVVDGDEFTGHAGHGQFVKRGLAVV